MTENAIMNIALLSLLPALIIAWGIGHFFKGIGERSSAKADQAASEAKKAKYDYKLAQLKRSDMQPSSVDASP